MILLVLTYLPNVKFLIFLHFLRVIHNTFQVRALNIVPPLINSISVYCFSPRIAFALFIWFLWKMLYLLLRPHLFIICHICYILGLVFLSSSQKRTFSSYLWVFWLLFLHWRMWIIRGNLRLTSSIPFICCVRYFFIKRDVKRFLRIWHFHFLRCFTERKLWYVLFFNKSSFRIEFSSDIEMLNDQSFLKSKMRMSNLPYLKHKCCKDTNSWIS